MAINVAVWKRSANELKTETYVIYLAVKHPKVQWYVKAFALSVLAYAMSPIDLIPDFIPVLGYLDDLILIPVGITLTIRMIPADVLAECRAKTAARIAQGKLLGWVGAAFILAVWLAVGTGLFILFKSTDTSNVLFLSTIH